MIKALSPTVVEMSLTARWVVDVRVVDDNGCRVVGVVPTVTVTPPSGSSSTVTPESIPDGGYRAIVTPTTLTGRWTVQVTAVGYGLVDFVAYVVGDATFPDVAAVKLYAGTMSQTDEEIESAIAAEAAVQRRVCRVPAVLPENLREALCRRVVVNLDKRKQRNVNLPDEGGPRFTPTNDPEVRRLEGPQRKWVVA